jgi:hypothetical protein
VVPPGALAASGKAWRGVGLLREIGVAREPGALEPGLGAAVLDGLAPGVRRAAGV